jgi:predicted metal-binding membrane protein
VRSGAPPIAALPRRDRLLISTCLALITALAWVYLIRLDRQMSSMAAMAMSPRTDVLFTFLMWAVMMVGMMAGSALPVLLLFGSARAARGEGHVPLAVLVFGFGYAVVWAAFSLCAALAQSALHQAAMLSPAMSTSSQRVGGAILIAAGLYQLTPFKGACLTRCRSPLGFLITNWRDGNLGAFGMGLRHGAYCLGCCWALMCVLFVVGVMNLIWVAALSVLVLAEKMGPGAAIVARVAGAVMIVAGVLVAAGVT